jgi:uncharacterized MAPEG superfamily protein
MTSLFWVPYILDRMAVRGLWGTLSAAIPETGAPQSGWAQRAIRAHYNAIENLAIFVPAVLVAHLLGVSNSATKFAAILYFVARFIHFVVYTAEIPALRTLTFAAGWAAQMIFLASILKWI